MTGCRESTANTNANANTNTNANANGAIDAVWRVESARLLGGLVRLTSGMRLALIGVQEVLGMFSSKQVSVVIALGVAVGVTLSCAATQEESMTPAAGVAPRFTSWRAIESIADGRCKRTEKCEKLGKAGSAFKSYDDCRAQLRTDLQRKFANDACENGVGAGDLRACLREIEEEDCSGVAGVVDSIERYIACRPGKLCLN